MKNLRWIKRTLRIGCGDAGKRESPDTGQSATGRDMDAKSAVAYSRKDRIFVLSEERTDFGTREALPLIEITGLSDEMQGQAVLFALSCYRPGEVIPNPKMPNKDYPLYRLAGVRSWTAFVEFTKCVDISQDGSGISLVPSRNAGARQGFKHMKDDRIAVDPLPEKIGRALHLAFKKCE